MGAALLKSTTPHFAGNQIPTAIKSSVNKTTATTLEPSHWGLSLLTSPQKHVIPANTQQPMKIDIKNPMRVPPTPPSAQNLTASPASFAADAA